MAFPKDPNAPRPHPHGDPIVPRPKQQPTASTPTPPEHRAEVDKLVTRMQQALADLRLEIQILLHDNESLKRENAHLRGAFNPFDFDDLDCPGFTGPYPDDFDDEGPEFWQDGDVWSDDDE